MQKFIERLAWGTDAGFYRLIPEEVLMPANVSEVVDIVRRAKREGKHITFRAAGTSLSGQAITDSLLVVCGKKWEGYEVLDGGARIRVQPGVVGGRVNAILKPYGYKFLPDPASVNSAMVGGITLNNASGMSCGTHANAERTILSAKVVFADGTVLDTGDAESRSAFAVSHPDFMKRLCALRDRVQSDPELKDHILRKYSIKNVTGLTILPFAECEDPFEIITRLIPGSEGTLMFLAEATFRTGKIAPASESALLLFPTTHAACEAVAAMKATGALTAAEFFDRKAMRTVEKDFPELAGLPEEAGAVLVMTEGTPEEVAEKRRKLEAVLSSLTLCTPAVFTGDPAVTGKWWAMRSGIFPAVGGTREIGTTCLIEDVAVPVPRLAEFTDDLQQLFKDHGYPDAVIYGHALEGNWHFILNQRFDTPEVVAQYDNMMRAVVKLVTEKYQGSLKAEHGTGRNMAPFVRVEWGDKAYQLMKDVKALFDPDNLFNPGVIFNDDPQCHISGLKPLPRIHPLVDRCIECGFCEVNCVSCGYALSSRQRIVVSREIARLAEQGKTDPAARRASKRLARDFHKLGDALCAGDGLCSTSCPVKINVGEYIHVVRERAHGALARRMGKFAADHLNVVAGGVSAMLGLAACGQAVLGNKAMSVICKAIHRGSFGLVPLWTPAMPHRARIKSIKVQPTPAAEKVVYFPSCINQRMGPAKGDPVQRPLVDETVELLGKAGYEVVFPKNLKNLCCGMTWESKGMPDVADEKTVELEAALREASENGRWPILCDQSPCLHRMREKITGLKLYEPVEFIDKFVLDRVEIEPVDACVAVHATCTTRKMGLVDTLLKVARTCARKAVLPEEIGCCAFAGDKGFTNPELNAWALRKLRARIAEAGATMGYSNSRTCEIGLTNHSGIPYMGIVYLVNRVARKNSFCRETLHVTVCDGIALVIPVCDPDEDRFPTLVRRLRADFAHIVVVDDGSARGRSAFDDVRGDVDAVLIHENNRGKGAALRTAFAWVRENLPRMVGVVTVDGDGQHDPEDVRRVAEELAREPNGGLVLGVRSFAGDVPFRSRLGNFWTRGLFRLITGLSVSDTQTGLRGIPAVLLPRLLTIPGDRYEYEIRMLADTRHHPAPPREVSVRTIYLDGNAASHYRPLRDTFRTQLALWGTLFNRKHST